MTKFSIFFSLPKLNLSLKSDIAIYQGFHQSEIYRHRVTLLVKIMKMVKMIKMMKLMKMKMKMMKIKMKMMKMKMMKIKVKMSMMMMKKVSHDDGYFVMKVIM